MCWKEAEAPDFSQVFFFFARLRSRRSQLVSVLLVLNPLWDEWGEEGQEGRVKDGSLEIQTLVKQWDW